MKLRLFHSQVKAKAVRVSGSVATVLFRRLKDISTLTSLFEEKVETLANFTVEAKAIVTSRRIRNFGG